MAPVRRAALVWALLVGWLAAAAAGELHDAAARGDCAAVTRLLDRDVAIDAPNKEGLTALHVAAAAGQLAAARLLMERGARANALSEHGDTPLHAAATAEMAELLVAKGADFRIRDGGGQTPLFDAVQKNRPDVLRFLLSLGADPDTRDDLLQRPLHFANRPEMARTLLDAGAKVNAVDEDGGTPLHWAVGNPGDHDPVPLLAVAKLLIERGANLNAQNRLGRTPLHEAVEGGQIESVRLLLDRGAKRDTRAASGWTALHLAIWRLEPAMVKLLVERGASLKVRNERGQTPLQLAVAHRAEEVRQGAEPADYDAIIRLLRGAEQAAR